MNQSVYTFRIFISLIFLLVLSCKKTPDVALPLPTISSVSPAEGYAGQAITITGTALDGAAITVGAEAAATSNATPTSVQFTVPNVALGVQKITLKATGGTVTFDTFKVIAVPPKTPVVSSFSPTQGTPGTEVTVTGQNFGNDLGSNTVKFNGTQATIKSANATQIVAIVPDAATTGAISVGANGQTGNSSSNFTVIVPKVNSLAPAEGGAGTSVVINGEGFSSTIGDINVGINGITAKVTAASPQQITFEMPNRAGTGTVTVAVKGKVATSPSVFTYKYQIGTNTTLFSSSIRVFQSTAVDPDNGTVYASDRNNSSIIVAPTTGSAQAVNIRDNAGANHVSLTGITIVKTGLGGTSDKLLIVTNEAKGVFAYLLSAITVGASPSGTLMQANDAIYNSPTSIVGVSQSPSTTYTLNGTYYMACFGSSAIVRSVRLNGVTQSPVIVGSPGSSGFNPGSVPSINAKFNGVVGVTLKNNLLYVADEGNHAIRVIDYNAGTVNTLVGNGSASNATGAFGATRLNLPSNVVVDNSGLIYVTDRGNGRIVMLDPRSQTSQTLISGLNAPYGLSIDNAGALYVGEWGAGTNRILKLTVK